MEEQIINLSIVLYFIEEVIAKFCFLTILFFKLVTFNYISLVSRNILSWMIPNTKMKRNKFILIFYIKKHLFRNGFQVCCFLSWYFSLAVNISQILTQLSWSKRMQRSNNITERWIVELGFWGRSKFDGGG